MVNGYEDLNIGSLRDEYEFLFGDNSDFTYPEFTEDVGDSSEILYKIGESPVSDKNKIESKSSLLIPGLALSLVLGYSTYRYFSKIIKKKGKKR